jgi:hypothetical protein
MCHLNHYYVKIQNKIFVLLSVVLVELPIVLINARAPKMKDLRNKSAISVTVLYRYPKHIKNSRAREIHELQRLVAAGYDFSSARAVHRKKGGELSFSLLHQFNAFFDSHHWMDFSNVVL